MFEVPPSSRFTWIIDKFNRLYTKEHYSDVFTAGGYKWRLKIFPMGNTVDQLSVYLEAADSANLPYRWSRYAQFSLAVVNQIHHKYTVRKDTQHKFTARQTDWGFTSFMPLSDLYDPSRGYLANDTCIVEAEVAVRKITDYWTFDSRKETATQSGERLFEEGSHSQMDETYENIGGYSVLKAQASLYKQIWVKYGHIASSKVQSASYVGQVLIVAEIMKSIVEMHQSHLQELSTEIVNTWKEKLKFAESLDFHFEWLRERLEDVKKDFHEMQKLEIELEGQRQSLLDAQARVTKADDEVKKLQAELLVAKDESVKARENKAAVESGLNPVLANVEICLGKRKNLLFEGLP
ncbi:hypothetical protein MKX01_002836 [Papaver californicum]|nr:hypothetical protein MKX01_002836 [Papaver californicum]